MVLRQATPSELDVAIAIDDDASELYATAGIVLRFPEGVRHCRFPSSESP